MNIFPKTKAVAALLLLLSLSTMAAPTVKLELGNNSFYQNETFLLQIRVEGAKEQPQNPVLPNAFRQSFNVQMLQPSRNNSTQVSIINGKMSKVVHNEWILRMNITPLKKGKQQIPSMTLNIDGTAFRTNPIDIFVKDAEKLEDLGFELELPNTPCYVGQPVMLTWNWYVGRSVDSFQFDLPVLDAPAFSCPDYQPDIPDDQQDNYLIFMLSDNRRGVARKQMATWKGMRVQKVSLSLPVIPLKAGTLAIPESAVAFAIEDRRRQPRNRSPFDDFFGPARSMKQVRLTAPAATLDVREVPQEGRPATFSGIIGPCRIEAQAEPRDVCVGDPIILTITLTGPSFLDNVRLPPLATLPELTDFKVSDEEPGMLKEKGKVFQCTLRATRADIAAIPSIAIPYLNPTSGRYEFAKSEAIPITVSNSTQVTLRDVEGMGAEPASPPAMELQAAGQGLAPNAEGAALLQPQRRSLRQWTHTAPWIAIVYVLPTLFVLLLGVTRLLALRNANPAALAARQAAAKADAALAAIAPNDGNGGEKVLDALRAFFGAKLNMPAGALVFKDIEQSLQKANAAPELANDVKRLFDVCEASRYGGAAFLPADLPSQARRLIDQLNRIL